MTRHRRDPMGRRALFEFTASEAAAEHHDTAVPIIACSTCGERTPTGWTDLAARKMWMSAWLPRRDHRHWMRCPACEQRTWCRIELRTRPVSPHSTGH